VILGCAILGGGIYVPRLVYQKFADGLRDNVLITPTTQKANTTTYQWWLDNGGTAPNSIYYRVYMWNCTNYLDVVNGGAKPNMTQSGPYIYRQITKRLNVQFGHDEDGNPTVSYQPWIYYIFDRDRTPANLDPESKVWTANMPFQGIKATLSPHHGVFDPFNPFYALPVIWDDTPEPERLFTHRSVREMLFGYRDEHLAKYAPSPYYPGLVFNQSLEGALKGPPFTQRTGEFDWSQIRQYTRWGTPPIPTSYDYLQCNRVHNKSTNYPAPAWGSNDATYVHGTDGLQFQPGLRHGQTLTQWFDVMYRSLPFTNFNNTEVVVNGITLLRFTIPEWVLENSTVVPSNAQYYSFGPKGLFNITSCATANVPIFLSKPHFLHGAHELREMVNGLHPNHTVHETILDVEPWTGITMQAYKRIQINVHLQHVPTIQGDWFKKINSNLMLPLVWIDGGNTIGDVKSQDFKDNVYYARTMHDVIYYTGFGVGNAFVLLGLAIMSYAVVIRGKESARSSGYAQRLVSPAEESAAEARYPARQQASSYRSTG